jgi:hypothetical protein
MPKIADMFSTIIGAGDVTPHRGLRVFFAVTHGGARKASLALGWLVFGLWPSWDEDEWDGRGGSSWAGELKAGG